jgi:hypothetical protein
VGGVKKYRLPLTIVCDGKIARAGHGRGQPETIRELVHLRRMDRAWERAQPSRES